MITTFDGSATFSTLRQPSGRNDRSSRQAVSTSTTATSPGDTFANPPARARIFSVIVIPMALLPPAVILTGLGVLSRHRYVSLPSPCRIRWCETPCRHLEHQFVALARH